MKRRLLAVVVLVATACQHVGHRAPASRVLDPSVVALVGAAGRESRLQERRPIAYVWHKFGGPMGEALDDSIQTRLAPQLPLLRIFADSAGAQLADGARPGFEVYRVREITVERDTGRVVLSTAAVGARGEWQASEVEYLFVPQGLSWRFVRKGLLRAS